MKKNKRLEKLSKLHFRILDTLENNHSGELRNYGKYYRLVDYMKNPICNIKRFYIDDLIEHGNIIKQETNFTIIKN